MRTWLILPLLLAGCDWEVAPPPGGDDTGPVACAQPGWVPARNASLVMTRLQVDVSPLIPAFSPNLVVDGQPAACVAPDGMGATWFFTVGGEPFGSITLIPTGQGDLDLVTEGTVEIDLFGAEGSPVFRGPHVRVGSWTVQSTSPAFVTSVQNLVLEREGRTAELSFSAEATP